MRSDNLRPLKASDRQALRELTLQAVMALYCEDQPKAEVIELRASSRKPAA